MVRATITNLARAGLVSIDPASTVRTVRVHSSVQAAVRAYLTPADVQQAVIAAADALVQAWPEPRADQSAGPELDQALRTARHLCAAQGIRGARTGADAPVPGDSTPDALASQDTLWQPDGPSTAVPPGPEPGGCPARRLGDGLLADGSDRRDPLARADAPQHDGGQGPARRRLRVGRARRRCHRGAGQHPRRPGPQPGPRTPRHHRGPWRRDAYSSAGLPAEAVAL